MASTMRLFGGGLLVLCGVTGGVAGVSHLLPYGVVAADSFWRDEVWMMLGGAAGLAYLCGARPFER